MAPNLGLPTKLAVDSILEAVVELRFETTAQMLPEVIFGRFADNPEWSDYRQARLPTADIPAALKQLEPGLRFQPSLAFTSPDGAIRFQIGSNVLIVSRRKEYVGWDVFRPTLLSAVRQLFRSVINARLVRIGLRYINALNTEHHFINSISDLGIEISVGSDPINQRVNLNFTRTVSVDCNITSRIATPDFAEGSIPPNTVALVDIDVYTPDGTRAWDEGDVLKWIDGAHQAEKEAFFDILGDDLTEKLRAD